MKQITRSPALFRAVQIIWGFPQTAAGFLFFLFHLKRPRLSYRGAVVTEWGLRSSVSLGMFLFLSDRAGTAEERKRLLRHEYGHSVQSLLFGPLYLPVIGIPSALWAGLPFFRRKRAAGTPYSGFYTESGADILGGNRTDP